MRGTKFVIIVFLLLFALVFALASKYSVTGDVYYYINGVAGPTAKISVSTMCNPGGYGCIKFIPFVGNRQLFLDSNATQPLMWE